MYASLPDLFSFLNMFNVQFDDIVDFLNCKSLRLPVVVGDFILFYLQAIC